MKPFDLVSKEFNEIKKIYVEIGSFRYRAKIIFLTSTLKKKRHKIFLYSEEKNMPLGKPQYVRNLHINFVNDLHNCKIALLSIFRLMLLARKKRNKFSSVPRTNFRETNEKIYII